MSRNLNQGAGKDTLAQWVSLSLHKALTENNIKKGFSGTGIWPLNEHAVNAMLAPSESFRSPHCDVNMGSAQHDPHVGGQLHEDGQENLPGTEPADGG
jgi:hypothetical protein